MTLDSRLKKLESASPNNQQTVEVYYCDDGETNEQTEKRLELPTITKEDNIHRIFVDFTP